MNLYQNRLPILTFIIFALTGFASSVRAAPFSDYHQRVSNATHSLESLKSSYSASDMWSEQEVRATVTKVRQSLPASEEVTTQSGSRINVDNAWLQAALADYLKMNHADQSSGAALSRIIERLQALDERLTEIENGKATHLPDKDAERARLAEILRRTEYQTKTPQQQGESALTRWLVKFLQWLSRLFPKAKPLPPGSAVAISRAAQVGIIGFSLIIIVFLIWKFGPGLFRGRRKKKKTKREARIVLGETLEPDQTAADLLAQAEALARTGDVRAAIRKAYIALLCELGDRKVISLAQYKTNRDYLNAVRERSSLYSAMKRLTHSFEVHWYGFYPAAENEWNDFRQVCRQALSLQ